MFLHEIASFSYEHTFLGTEWVTDCTVQYSSIVANRQRVRAVPQMRDMAWAVWFTVYTYCTSRSQEWIQGEECQQLSWSTGMYSASNCTGAYTVLTVLHVLEEHGGQAQQKYRYSIVWVWELSYFSFFFYRSSGMFILLLWALPADAGNGFLCNEEKEGGEKG